MRVGLFITVRLKSTRLPEKAMLMIKGKPLIVHLIERIKKAKKPHLIVLCTSDLEQDDPLEKIAADQAIECYRGDPDDVLLRLTNAAKKYDLDYISSCTGDNPFVDPEYIDKLLEFHINNKLDYSKTEGLPFVVFSYCLTRKAMEKACEIKDMTDTEVWGGYFTDTGLFKWDSLKVSDPSVYGPDIRLTVDTKEDFNLINKIFDYLYKEEEIFSLRDIMLLLKNKPDLLKINSNISQKPGLKIKIKTQYKNCEN